MTQPRVAKLVSFFVQKKETWVREQMETVWSLRRSEWLSVSGC